MSDAAKLVTMNDAYGDLLQRTLSTISTDLGCLIYLAATRDYNSGTYHHEGLSLRYGAEQARNALQSAHHEVFRRVTSSPLQDLVEQLEVYIRMAREAPEEFIQAWQELEPFRIAIPMQADSTMAQLFLSNVRVALGVLRFRRSRHSASP